MARRWTLPLAIAGSALFLAAAALGAKSTLTDELPGRWVLNQDASDDLEQKMTEMRLQRHSGGPGGAGAKGGGRGGGPRAGGAMGGPGGGGGGGPTGGSGGGRGGSGGPDGSGKGQPPDRETMRAQMESLQEGIEELSVAWRDSRLSIVGGSGEEQTLLPDGKKRECRTLSGEVLPAKAKWKGDALVVRWKRESGKIVETYRVGSHGQQLYVTVEIDGEGPMDGLEIRRVYDRKEGGSSLASP